MEKAPSHILDILLNLTWTAVSTDAFLPIHSNLLYRDINSTRHIKNKSLWTTEKARRLFKQPACFSDRGLR